METSSVEECIRKVRAKLAKMMKIRLQSALGHLGTTVQVAECPVTK